MGKKSKKQRKREERDQVREAEEAAGAIAAARLKRMRIGAVIVPLVALGAALGVYFGMNNRQLAGLVGMVGVALWVPLLLGSVGGAITPRDRTRAGSIDFGNKR